MKTFLTQVVDHFSVLPGNHCFVFPNRRSLVHFRKDAEALGYDPARYGTVTMDELFRRIYGHDPADRIRLLVELHAAWLGVSGTDEPLDEFLSWGATILSDFDDADRALADVDALFSPVSEDGDIDTARMTDVQRKAAVRLARSYADVEGKHVKRLCRENWNRLRPLYHAFRERLDASGLAYGGMIYRAVAERICANDTKSVLRSVYPGADRYVFVGLNTVSFSEKALMSRIKDAGMGFFVWDFCSSELTDPANVASRSIRKNLVDFPQAFQLEAVEGRPHVDVVAVPSTVGMAKLAPDILAASEGEPEDTAFILPDGKLLMPLLSAIPEEYGDVNVTMGYPLSRSAAASLVKALCSLHVNGGRNDEGHYFYFTSVVDVFSNPLVKAVLTDEEKEFFKNWRSALHPRTYASEFTCGETAMALFRGVLTSLGKSDPEQNAGLAGYLSECLLHVGRLYAAKEDADVMELEFLRDCREAVLSLDSIKLAVKPATWVSSLESLVRSETVPFDGEPLRGIQVMGFLETRALDFRNVIILGANEDVLPSKGTSSSVIPARLRSAFGLSVESDKDADQAYYFYRLIQRAETVRLAYDSRTDGLLPGEESRFIKQLRYQFGFDLNRITVTAPLQVAVADNSIVKTQADVDAIRNGHLSASSVQAYLSCQAKFYYQSVKGLDPGKEAEEDLDNAMFGTVFHAVMEGIYSGRREVTVNDLRELIVDTAGLRERVEKAIKDETKCDEVAGRNLVVAEVITTYVSGTLRHDLDLLVESGSNAFRIIGLERKLKMDIDGIEFIGFADRIDTYRPGVVRIVDYKTGRVEHDDVKIDDNNAKDIAEKVFGPSNSGRPKIALQLYLYDRFAHGQILKPGEKVTNAIYCTSRIINDPLPEVPESEAFVGFMNEKLSEKLREMTDVSVPFTRTEDKATCGLCDFRAICGR